MKNAILVYAESGIAKHRFCPEAEARAFMQEAERQLENASMFTVDVDDAEFALKCCGELRDLLADAKISLVRNDRFKKALDRNNIPMDRELRKAIHKAFSELYD